MPWLIPDAHTQAVEAAREIVLRRLDRSAAPRAALAELLERKEVDSRVASEVLDRLEAAGVIDDTAYAARLARTRFAEKGAARRAIAEELRRKGLGESDVAEALEQIKWLLDLIDLSGILPDGYLASRINSDADGADPEEAADNPTEGGAK